MMAQAGALIILLMKRIEEWQVQRRASEPAKSETTIGAVGRSGETGLDDEPVRAKYSPNSRGNLTKAQFGP
jgi:hypothetical protein